MVFKKKFSVKVLGANRNQVVLTIQLKLSDNADNVDASHTPNNIIFLD